MHHFRANFPLSVFLRGTAAIDKHPKPRRFARRGGSLYEFARLEANSEGDETIDGLECAKIRCRRWYRDAGEPTIQILWLAKERNYLCVRSQTLNNRGAISDEGNVTQWRELKPGFWLPGRAVIQGYAPPGRAAQGPVAVEWDEELIVDEAAPDPNYPLSRFRDIKLPDNLPVYRIDADGYFEDNPRRASAQPRPQGELDHLIALVRAEEERYARYDVTADTTYRHVHHRDASNDLIMSQQIDERSLAFDGRLYCQLTRVMHSGNGSTSRADKVSVFDGNWNRERWQSWSEDTPGDTKHSKRKRPGPVERTQHEFGNLGRCRPDVVEMFRPHTAIFVGDWLRSDRLSSLLASQMYDKVNSYRLKVDYLGPERRDGFDCEKLWCAYDSGGGRPPASGFYLWLAKERNYLPIHFEAYLLEDDRLPIGVGNVDDLREAAPGLWYPYHAVRRGHVSNDAVEGFCEGRILIAWAYEQRIRELIIPSVAPATLFQVNLPAGITVGIFTGKHRDLGTIRQMGAGPAAISDEKWQTMLLADRASDEECQKRKLALAALVGRPVPAMPELEWVQGGPHSWNAMKGQVVLLFFWSEWQHPKGTFEPLAAAAGTLTNPDVTVIGIHPRGSTLEEVRRTLQEFQPHAAIAVDAPGKNQPSWGALYERFGLKDVSHAFVIDREGNIAAEGSIGQMIRKAGEISRRK